MVAPASTLAELIVLDRYGIQTTLQHGVATVIEWDDAQAASNVEAHGISFPEAATAFADPHAIFLDDGSRTDRLTVIGTSIRNRLLWVVHVERGERDRIISARRAIAPSATSTSLEFRS